MSVWEITKIREKVIIEMMLNQAKAIVPVSMIPVPIHSIKSTGEKQIKKIEYFYTVLQFLKYSSSNLFSISYDWDIYW